MNNFTFVYTDGSLYNHIPAYAITTDNSIIKMAILPTDSSVFTAEIITILKTIILVNQTDIIRYIKFKLSNNSQNQIQYTSCC